MTDDRIRKRIYCFDTSAFLTIHRRGSDNFIAIPTDLWDKLESMMIDCELISHRTVFDEISSDEKNPDFVSKWVRDKRKYFLARNDNQIAEIPKIIKRFPDLIDHYHEHEQADPWVIALAIEKLNENNLFELATPVVVSQENPKSPTKIPEVCKYFEIEHLTLKEFFIEVGVEVIIKK